MRSHVRRPSRKCTESRCQENANIPDINREVQEAKNVVNDTTRGHQAGVHCPANYTSQGIPSGGVKPVPEFLIHAFNIRTKIIVILTHIEAIIRKNLRRTAVGGKKVQARDAYT